MSSRQMRISEAAVSGHPQRMLRRVSAPPEDEVGKRLYFVRLALNFTEQKDFAPEMGVAPNTYNEYEKGKKPPSQRSLERLWTNRQVPPEFIREGALDRLPHGLWLKLDQAGAFGPLPVMGLGPRRS